MKLDLIPQQQVVKIFGFLPSTPKIYVGNLIYYDRQKLEEELREKLNG